MLSKSHTSSTITNWPSLESGLCISWKDSSASGGNWAVRGSVISMIALWHPGNAHWARIVGGLVPRGNSSGTGSAPRMPKNEYMSL